MEKKEEKEEVFEEEKTSTPKKRSSKKSYEVILVAENYVVYKYDNDSNAWIPKPRGKEVKVGDRIKL